MTCLITPEWEYWTGDPEVEELLREASGDPDPVGELTSPRARRHGPPGLRFGRGDPDRYHTHLAAPRPDRPAAPSFAVTCRVCGGSFLTRDPKRRHCSQSCWRKRGARLAACRQCGVAFEPAYRSQELCSLACVGLSQRKARPESGCARCGAPVPPSRSRNGAPRIYCSRRCKHNAVVAASRLRKACPAAVKEMTADGD